MQVRVSWCWTMSRGRTFCSHANVEKVVNQIGDKWVQQIGLFFVGHTNTSRRAFSSPSSPPPSRPTKVTGDHDLTVTAYLENTLGIDAKLHQGILKTIESFHGSGRVDLDLLKNLGTETIQAMAVAEEQDERRKQKKRKKSATAMVVPISIKIPYRTESVELNLQWKVGDSLLELAKKNDEILGDYNIMEGACGGNMNCCTCHVYISSPDFRNMLDEPSVAELDMIDMAFEPRETSRLGCQVRLRPSKGYHQLGGTNLGFEIPKGVNNIWDP